MAQELGRPNLAVRLVGGRLRTRTEAAVGDWAVRTLTDADIDDEDITAFGEAGVEVVLA